MVGHSPDVFWDLSFPEVFSIITGFKEFHGGAEKEPPMTRDRMNEMIDLYYPDAKIGWTGDG